MGASFWFHYGFALGVVALALLGLHAIVKLVAARAGLTSGRRTITVIETVAFTPGAQLHVVSAGSRRVLVGTTRDAIAYLGDLATEGERPSTAATPRSG
jgi:flagellar biogenesis protein FliO